MCQNAAVFQRIGQNQLQTVEKRHFFAPVAHRLARDYRTVRAAVGIRPPVFRAFVAGKIILKKQSRTGRPRPKHGVARAGLHAKFFKIKGKNHTPLKGYKSLSLAFFEAQQPLFGQKSFEKNAIEIARKKRRAIAPKDTAPSRFFREKKEFRLARSER